MAGGYTPSKKAPAMAFHRIFALVFPVTMALGQGDIETPLLPRASLSQVFENRCCFYLAESDPTAFEKRSISERTHLLTKTHIESFEYFYLNAPIWGARLTVLRAPNGRDISQGFIPSRDIVILPASFKRPSLDQTMKQLPGIAARVLSEKPVWFPTEETVVSALHIVWTTQDGRTLEAVANEGRLFDLQSRSFNLEGMTRAYVANSVDGKLVDETFEFSGDGYLTNSFFQTQPQGVNRAYQLAHQFFYETTDEVFPEVNVFAHANRARVWHEAQGFVWYGKPIILKLHDLASSGGKPSTNNAVYLPGGTDTAANIVLGDGDGNVLQNLSTDMDAVAHEFSHHVIYRSLTSTKINDQQTTPDDEREHSLAIHEGLADFFVFAMTNDDCLGESICPEVTTSTLCVMPGKCLRTANNTLKFGSDEYWGLSPHKRGQLISGLFWDVRKNAADQVLFDKVVEHAVDFLPTKGSYRDLLAAFSLSDSSLTKGLFSCDVAEQAKSRSFSEDDAAGLIRVCSEYKALEDSKTSTDEVTTEPAREDSNSDANTTIAEKPAGSSPPKKKSTSLCGVVSESNPIVSGLWLMLPFLFFAFRL